MARDFDIEKFPVSPAAKTMMSYIPANFYYRSYVGKWMFEAMGQQMDISSDTIKNLADQFFVDTATWGLIWHEEMFGLPMRPWDTDYEARRRRIRAKRDEKIPMSPWHMEEIIKDITGYDAHVYEINEENEDGFVPTHPNRFRVMIEGEELLNLSTVIKKIRRVKQSHTRFELAVSLMKIVNEEDITFPRVRFLFSTQWWDFILDGRYMLNGEKFLGWKYPPSFWPRFQFGFTGQDVFDFTDAYGIVIRNEIDLAFKRVTYRMPLIWWDWVLDGKYLLDGQKQLTIQCAEFRPVIRIPFKWHDWTLNGEYLLNGERYLNDWWIADLFRPGSRFTIDASDYAGHRELNVRETYTTGMEILTAEPEWSRQAITTPVSTIPDETEIGFNWLVPILLNGAVSLNGAVTLNGGREAL